MNIEAILRFYFRESEEVSGRAAIELPEKLLGELRSFAAADLPQEELEEFCARIASNSDGILKRTSNEVCVSNYCRMKHSRRTLGRWSLGSLMRVTWSIQRRSLTSP